MSVVVGRPRKSTTAVGMVRQFLDGSTGVLLNHHFKNIFSFFLGTPLLGSVLQRSTLKISSKFTHTHTESLCFLGPAQGSGKPEAEFLVARCFTGLEFARRGDAFLLGHPFPGVDLKGGQRKPRREAEGRPKGGQRKIIYFSGVRYFETSRAFGIKLA